MERPHSSENCGFSKSCVIKNKNTTSEHIQEENVTRTYIQPFPGRKTKCGHCLPTAPPRCTGLTEPIHGQGFSLPCTQYPQGKEPLFIFPNMPRYNRHTSTVNVSEHELMVHVCTVNGEGQGQGKVYSEKQQVILHLIRFCDCWTGSGLRRGACSN